MVCGELQDSKHFPEYNICTTCCDLLEDLMSEYFLRTIRQKESDLQKGYLKYLMNSSRYISDYKKIQQGTKRQIQQVGDRLRNKLEDQKPDQRYLEQMLKTLDWLTSTPAFYNYYFKHYYVCPSCKASIFENFDDAQVGDWLIISCEKCGTVIKKYYSPKLV